MKNDLANHKNMVLLTNGEWGHCKTSRDTVFVNVDLIIFHLFSGSAIIIFLWVLNGNFQGKKYKLILKCESGMCLSTHKCGFSTAAHSVSRCHFPLIYL